MARQTDADAVGHGATGKGNDQVRFELTYMALDPELKIIAPWKDPNFELRDRESAIDYAQKHNIPIPVSKKKIYSQDRNLWHISHEGAEIEHPDSEPNWEACLTMTTCRRKRRQTSRRLSPSISRRAIPSPSTARTLPAHEVIAELKQDRRKTWRRHHRAGRKPPGRHEDPRRLRDAGRHDPLRSPQSPRTNLHRARHRSITNSKSPCATPNWSTTANGSTPCAKRCKPSSTTPTPPSPARHKVRLFKGRAMAVGAKSPHTLYDPQLASFSMEGYDVTAARGFIDLFGLPMKVASQAKKW